MPNVQLHLYIHWSHVWELPLIELEPIKLQYYENRFGEYELNTHTDKYLMNQK